MDQVFSPKHRYFFQFCGPSAPVFTYSGPVYSSVENDALRYELSLTLREVYSGDCARLILYTEVAQSVIFRLLLSLTTSFSWIEQMVPELGFIRISRGFVIGISFFHNPEQIWQDLYTVRFMGNKRIIPKHLWSSRRFCWKLVF